MGTLKVSAQQACRSPTVLCGSRSKTWPLTPWLTMKTEGGSSGGLEGDVQRRLVGDETVGLIELVRPAQGPEQLDRTVRT